MTAVELKLRSFESKILFFNGLYKLPIAPYPTTAVVIADERKKHPLTGLAEIAAKDFLIHRLRSFQKTILKEVEEVEDIISAIASGEKEGQPYTEMDCLVDIADWLNDMTVYCRSECVKYGIPAEEVLSIIMSSNFSKLGADGQPIYDDAGKVMKGPMYWKPEPQIQALLLDRMIEASETDKKTVAEKGIVWRSAEKE